MLELYGCLGLLVQTSKGKTLNFTWFQVTWKGCSKWNGSSFHRMIKTYGDAAPSCGWNVLDNIVDSIEFSGILSENLFLFVCLFLLGIYFIYIPNVIPKVPHILSHTLPHPPTPTSWPWRSPVLRHIKLQDKWASLSTGGRLDHLLIHMQLEI